MRNGVKKSGDIKGIKGQERNGRINVQNKKIFFRKTYKDRNKNEYIKKKKTINIQINAICNSNTLFTENGFIWYYILKYY